jgi:hypothetical protein
LGCPPATATAITSSVANWATTSSVPSGETLLDEAVGRSSSGCIDGAHRDGIDHRPDVGELEQAPSGRIRSRARATWVEPACTAQRTHERRRGRDLRPVPDEHRRVCIEVSGREVEVGIAPGRRCQLGERDVGPTEIAGDEVLERHVDDADASRPNRCA